MEALENQVYFIAYIISNVFSLILLWSAWKWPRIARMLFSLLFAWACWANWTTVTQSPQAYVDYADLSFSGWYRQFIRGWFSRHIEIMVGIIATCQGLIALSMWGKGWVYKAGAAGAILFLVAIFPFGIGSAFPATLIMAAAMCLIWNNGHHYLWQKPLMRKSFAG
jgi:hypothetical protein